MEITEKNKKREANHEQKITIRVVFLDTNKLILLVFFSIFMLRFKLLNFQYKYVMVTLQNDPGLLIHGF